MFLEPRHRAPIGAITPTSPRIMQEESHRRRNGLPPNVTNVLHFQCTYEIPQNGTRVDLDIPERPLASAGSIDFAQLSAVAKICTRLE